MAIHASTREGLHHHGDAGSSLSWGDHFEIARLDFRSYHSYRSRCTTLCLVAYRSAEPLIQGEEKMVLEPSGGMSKSNAPT